MPSLSRRFKIEVKLNEKPAYRLAQLAGINPNDLYKLMSGISQPKPNDTRILKVGKLLGLGPDGCFQEEVPK
jgi:hypothetical protein